MAGIADPLKDDALLKPGEVAALLRVNPKTVAHWADNGSLSVVRTVGGHRRYYASEVERLLAELYEPKVAH